MFKGMGVSPGIVIAPVLYIGATQMHHNIPHSCTSPSAEIYRFKEALSQAIETQKALAQQTKRHITGDESAIFDAYSLILTDDSTVSVPIIEKIRENKLSAEYAVTLQFNEMADELLAIEDEYIRQRAEDFYNLRDLLLQLLLGENTKDISHLDRPSIIVTPSLTVPMVAQMDRSRVSGVLCETGNLTTHSAIFARALNIPMVIAPKVLFSKIKENDMVAFDGSSGEIWLNPSAEQREIISARYHSMVEQGEFAKHFIGIPTISKDGQRLELSANIVRSEELDSPLIVEADSIGLFRTETLYATTIPPSEEEQLSTYVAALEKVSNKSITFRTLDGYDAALQNILHTMPEKNPAMGYRGVRMSLSRPSFFRTQLRALLRASAYGNIKILLPMVSSVKELTAVIAAIENIKEELKRENILYDPNVPVGTMVEVPATALLADYFAAQSSFFSIGMHDLIQFTLAMDRSSQQLPFYESLYHPAPMALIKNAIDAAHRHSIPCNVCGDLSNMDISIPLLVGLGVDGISVNKQSLLDVRKILARCDTRRCKELVQQALTLSTSEDIVALVKQFTADY